MKEKQALPQPTLTSDADKKLEWYALFTSGSDMPWFYKFFCDDEWGHVALMAQVGPVVQVINPTWNRIQIGTQATPDGLPLNVSDYAEQLKEEGYTIIKIDHTPQRVSFKSIWVPGCVSLIKAFMGYNTSWYNITPKQLALSLLKSGGVLI